MFCPNCGKENPETSRFCGGCGMKLMPAGQMYAAEGNESSAGGGRSASVTEDTIPSAAGGRQYAGTGGQGAAVNGAYTAERAKGDDDSSGASGQGQGKKIAIFVILIAAAVILIVGINLVLSGTISFQSAEERWQEQYDLGQRYLLEQDYEQAVVAFTEAISIDENNADAYIGRAEAYLEADVNSASGENLTLALADYDTALELDDTMVELYLSEAKIYVGLGDDEGAVTAYSSAIEGELRTAEVYFGRAESYFALGTSVMEENGKGEELSPEAGNYLEKALSDYRTAMGLGDAGADMYRAAAEICLLLEDYETAEEILEEGLAACSGDEQLHELLEKARNLLSGQYKAAAYPAYYGKLQELQAEYGEVGLQEGDYGDSWLNGLCLAVLLDFDGNGQEELLLTYCAEDSISSYSVEVWGYEEDRLVQLYVGEPYILQTYRAVWVTDVDGEYFVVEGMSDGGTYSYCYGVQDGSFQLVKSILAKETEEDETSMLRYFVDDTEVTEEEYEEADKKWVGSCTKYVLTDPDSLDDEQSLDARIVLEETLDVLQAYVDGGTDAAVSVSAQIPQDAVMFGGHHYCLFDSGFTEEEALELCESIGGYLAVITSEEENAFLYDYITSLDCTSAYFGLTDREEESVWVWVNGEEVVYTNWHSGEPNSENENEDYAMFYWKYTDGTWNDGDWGGKTNSGGTAFLCEWDA